MALLMPWAVASIVAGIFWRFIFDTNHGIINGVLIGLGLMDQPFNWLSSTEQAVGIALVAQSWKSVPLLTILLLAALTSDPTEAMIVACAIGETIAEKANSHGAPTSQ